jgi:hypothetical protein
MFSYTTIAFIFSFISIFCLIIIIVSNFFYIEDKKRIKSLKVSHGFAGVFIYCLLFVLIQNYISISITTAELRSCRNGG